MTKLNTELKNANWTRVYNELNPNTSYEILIEILSAHIDECLPRKKLKVKTETNEWLTNGDVSIICVTETWFKHYMDDNNLSIEGFSVERKDRCDGRTGGGVACYIRNSFMYKRLSNLEEKELEVIWLKIMPKKLPRKFSCILIACIYTSLR